MGDLMGPQKGILKKTGANIYFESKGEGESVLLIHAGICDCRMWDRQFSALSDHFNVIRFDLPGYGFSDFTGGAVSYISIINELLNYLGVGKAHIMGASFGGKIAIDYALAEQEKCLSLILTSPAIRGWKDSQELVDYEIEEERLYTEGKLQEVAKHNLNMWILRERGKDFVSDSIKDLVLDMQMKSMNKVEPESPYDEVEEEEQIDRLETLKTPLLIIIGSDDVADFISMSELLCMKVRHSRRQVIQGTAHLPNMESPIVFNDMVLNFLLKR